MRLRNAAEEPRRKRCYEEFVRLSEIRGQDRAIARLRGVPVPEEAELIDDGGVYRWADPQLEHRTAAEKQLLRFGPENALRVQAKLGELARALELPAA